MWRRASSVTTTSPLRVLTSELQASSAAYADRVARTERRLAALEEVVSSSIAISDPRGAAMQPPRLTARERIALLFDDASDFLELGALTGFRQYGKIDVPGGGLVTGVGKIHGTEAMVIANDRTVKGGTIFPLGIVKQLRMMEIAAQNRLPLVNLVDSGGAFLPLQSEIFADRDMGGRTFYNQSLMSAAGIFQVAVVMGGCTAGGAYVPCMSDETIMVKKTGQIFLGGPPLVYAATGEIVTSEDLGGAAVHCELSGVADHYAESDEHAIAMAREVFADRYLASAASAADVASCAAAAAPPPLYDPRELRALTHDGVSATLPPTIAEDILARVLDGSEIRSFKARYGAARSVQTGFATIEGTSVGVIATQGLLCAKGLTKASHFVQHCEARSQPTLFIRAHAGLARNEQGRDEAGKVLKAAAQLGQIVAGAQMPSLTLIAQPSQPPTSETSDDSAAVDAFLGGHSFGSALVIAWAGQASGSLAPASELSEDDAADSRAAVRRLWTSLGDTGPESDALNGDRAVAAAARNSVDLAIDPAQSRAVIGRALRILTRPVEVAPLHAQRRQPVLRF